MYLIEVSNFVYIGDSKYILESIRKSLPELLSIRSIFPILHLASAIGAEACQGSTAHKISACKYHCRYDTLRAVNISMTSLSMPSTNSPK